MSELKCGIHLKSERCDIIYPAKENYYLLIIGGGYDPLIVCSHCVKNSNFATAPNIQLVPKGSTS